MPGLTFPLLLLGVVALALPVNAQAGWTSPVTLSAPGQDAIIPAVAIDEGGNAVVVWTRRVGTTDCGGYGCLRVQARARSAAGVLSAVQTLSAPGQHAYDQDVAVDQNGNAVVVWLRPDGTTDCEPGSAGCFRVQARARSAAGVLSDVQTLSAPGRDARDPHVGMDQSGNAVSVWLRADETNDCSGSPCLRVQARARSAAGVLGPTQTLSPAGHHAEDPQVAVDKSGNAIFMWARRGPGFSCSSCVLIQARARSATGVLSAIQTISDPGQNAGAPRVAVDAAGDAVLIWGQCCTQIEARARSAAGVLSTTQILSASGFSSQPELGVDQSGNAVVAWHLGTGIEGRARSAGGRLSSIQTITPVGGAHRVAVDSDGDAVFVWERLDDTTDCYDPVGGASGPCERIQARTRSANKHLGPITTLSVGGGDAEYPDVAVDPNGSALAVWQRWDGTSLRVQAAAGP